MKFGRKQNPILIVFLTIFIEMLGVGMLIPVIPLLLGDPASSYYLLPAGFNEQQGYILLGFLMACFPLMQFIFAPILGQLSDKYGRKKILLISLVGTAIAYLVFAYAILLKNIPLLFFARILGGAAGGTIAVAQATIADVTSPENRAKNFGLIGASFGLGFIFGPFIGGKFSDPNIVSWFNASTPFFLAAALTVINVVSAWLLLSETAKFSEEKPKINLISSFKNLKAGLFLKEVRFLFLISFLLQSGFAFFTSFFGVYLVSQFAFSQGQIGDFYALVGIFVAFTQIFLVRIVAKYLKENQLLQFSILMTGIGILLFIFPEVPWQIYLVTPVFTIFNGLTQANLTGLISRSVDGKIQGEILGIDISLKALANTIPPILSGVIAASFSPTASITVSAGLIILSGLIFLFFYRKSHKLGRINE